MVGASEQLLETSQTPQSHFAAGSGDLTEITCFLNRWEVSFFTVLNKTSGMWQKMWEPSRARRKWSVGEDFQKLISSKTSCISISCISGQTEMKSTSPFHSLRNTLRRAYLYIVSFSWLFGLRWKERWLETRSLKSPNHTARFSLQGSSWISS